MPATSVYPLMVRRLLGLLLLAAAALKIQGMAVAPVAHTGLFAAVWFQAAVILFEIGLGLWLLSGKRPLGAWLAALATFGCFAAVSFYQGWIGSSSCGCFGAVKVNPWYAFGLDILIVAALVFARPNLTPLWEIRRQSVINAVLPAAYVLAGIVLLSGVLLGLAHYSFGSIPAAIAYFRGEQISIEPQLVDVGEGTAGEAREVSVTLTNWTDEPIQVFGGTAN